MEQARVVFALVLVGVQALLVVPILVRLSRAHSARGISLVGELIWVVAGIGWAVYGEATGSLALVVSGSLAAATSGIISAISWRLLPTQHRMALLLSVVTAAAFIVGFAIAGEAGLTVTLSAFGVVQFLPQLRHSLQLANSAVPTEGVSVAGAVLRVVYSLGWAVYAGAWFLWGMSIEQIEWPLLAWGLAGAIAFAVQATVAIRSVRAE